MTLEEAAAEYAAAHAKLKAAAAKARAASQAYTASATVANRQAMRDAWAKCHRAGNADWDAMHALADAAVAHVDRSLFGDAA